MAAQPGLFAAGAAPSRAALQAAQARMMQDKGLQFSFAHAPPEPPPKPPPAWLKWLEDLLGGASHVLGWVFWGGVILVVVAFLAFIALEVARTRWPNLLKRKPKLPVQPAPWRPEEAVARALLEEADRLAAEGRYAEAARLILHRSIEDIEGHRPRLVRPAFTTREIALLDDLPTAARSTFEHIAQMVEHSFFGGRALDAAAFAECRRSYEAFAFPGAWA